VADHFSPSRTAHPLWMLFMSVLPSSPWKKAANRSDFTVVIRNRLQDKDYKIFSGNFL
jgi:hypothetical protein